MGNKKMNYKTGNRNRFRRENWNKMISAHKASGGMPLRDCVVVYLADGDNIDGTVLLQKGFSACNLFPVTNDVVEAKKIRASGSAAICAKLEDVVVAWRTPIHFLFADFCCGLERSVVRFSGKLWVSGAFYEGCVVSVNLLRGRDPASNILRQAFRDESGEAAPKERSIQFMAIHSAAFVMRCGINTDTEGEEFRHRYLESALIAQISYKSSAGSQYFDAILFNHLAPRDHSDGLCSDELLHLHQSSSGFQQASCQIAAAKAVNTRRRKSMGKL